MKGFDDILANKHTISGEFNRDAIIAVKSLIEESKTNYSPLFIYGDVGVGKTHIINDAKAYLKLNGCDDSSIIYFENKGLCKFLNDSLKNNEFHKSIDFDNTSIIIIDDVHQYVHMVRTQDYILDLLNKSREFKIPIILAGNNHPITMSNGFNPNLLSRLCHGLAVRIDVPDVKSRANFIDIFATKKGLRILPKIAGKMVEYFGSDFCTLQGVMNRFELFASVNNNAVIDDLVFDLIFKDEINHFRTPAPSSGETV
jgi:chromosomal replication initiator protein